jgi:diguanylate cyclase
VPETQDWKQKYRDALVEAEAEERRFRQVEQALRRLVGRLCAAAMGVSPALDDELSALAAANRRNAPAEELENLATSLTTVIVAVDAISPVIGPLEESRGRWEATCTAVGSVLAGLREWLAGAQGIEELIADVARAETDAELAVVVGSAADLVKEFGESVARERLVTAGVLSEVTQRLEEMGGYLSETSGAAQGGFEDTDSLNDGLLSQVRELSAEVRGATELTALQSRVSARLDTVTRQVQEFRARENARREEQAGRAARMHARIADLEREARELYQRLDREKQGARIDPLTRVANRKFFDERLARELARVGEVPVAMLLLDVDDFKVINDSYGHRAGDRVLQTVAQCLASGLREEDFVGRVGGEEFVVILAGLDVAGALRIANELRLSVEALRFHFRGTPVRVTVSGGVTELRRGDTPGAAFDRADAALYRAKREGKNACIAGDA